LDHESDVDDLDFDNFKGIYFGDENKKYQCPKTGCHFEYYDLCKRLSKLKEQRRQLDKELGLPPETPPAKQTDAQKASQKDKKKQVPSAQAKPD